MKRKSREISIFSMSALDLFASALGAFILIAVVMFPFFPNTGTADQRDLDEALERLQQEEEDNAGLQDVLSEIRQDLERRLEAARAAAQREVDAARQDAEEAREETTGLQQELSEAEVELQEVQDELRRVRLPHLDLVIALDITASMGNEIEGLKAELGELSSVLVSLAPSVAIGIVAFGDKNWETPVDSFAIAEISSSARNRNRMATFVRDLEVNKGLGSGRTNTDRPEAFLSALRTAAAMQWRSQAERRQIVLITDNPAYPNEVDASVRAAASFRERGSGWFVSTVFVRTEGNESSTAAFLRDVAEAGGGEAVQAGGSMTANLLLSLL